MLLEELGPRGWPKTSGLRGTHVNVRDPSALELHRGARRGARAVAREIAPRAVASRRRSGGRRNATASLPDYNQNAKDQTDDAAWRTWVRPSSGRARVDAADGERCLTATLPTLTVATVPASRRSVTRTRRSGRVAGA